MEDYLKFRKMITPALIQLFFWLGVAVVVIGSLVSMFTVSVWVGLLTLVIGPISVRVYCELVIVVFRILDTLVEIRDLRRDAASSSPAGV